MGKLTSDKLTEGPKDGGHPYGTPITLLTLVTESLSNVIKTPPDL
jgi:hypothetical protein